MTTSVSEVVRGARYSDRHTTFLKQDEYVYSWTINSFVEWLAEIGDKPQCSPLFPEEPASYKWKLRFYPEQNVENVTYCSVCIVLQTAPKAVNVKYELTMSDDKDKEIQKFNNGKALFTPNSGSSAWGWKKFITRETLLQQLKNNVLVISCKIEVNAGIVSERKTAEASAVGKELGNDLATLLAEEKFSDATITVGTNNFLVYKGILASRSSVFAAMFEQSLVGKKQNKFKLVDIQPEIFAKLLRYIYTDKVENLNSIAYPLFAAADKYCILPLKTLCQQSILANLSIQNAAKTLMLADEHHAEEMKTRVLQFLSSSAARGVTDTADWKSMARTHPHLVSEAFEAKGSIANAASP